MVVHSCPVNYCNLITRWQKPFGAGYNICYSFNECFKCKCYRPYNNIHTIQYTTVQLRFEKLELSVILLKFYETNWMNKWVQYTCTAYGKMKSDIGGGEAEPNIAFLCFINCVLDELSSNICHVIFFYSYHSVVI